MDERTAEALEASIKHWEENREVSKPEQAKIDANDCALCNLYVLDGCEGCPVAQRSGHKGCHGSPYFDARFTLADWRKWPDDPDRKQAWQKACDAEIAFLKSLRVPSS